MKKALIAIILLALTAGVAFKAKLLLKERTKEKESQTTPQNITLSVELVTPKEGSLSQKIQAFAKLESDKSVTISTKLAGFVEDVFVDEAQKVKRGDTLVKIDSEEIESSIKSLRSSLEAKKSSLEYAKGVYKRNLNLYSVGGLPREQLERSKIEVKSQEAMVKSTKEQIAQLKNRLSYLQIKAPFDGVVERVFLHKGDMAGAGKPIVKIASNSQKIIFNFVPSLISSVKKGSKVLLKGESEPLGEVKSIYPSSNQSLAQGEIKPFKNLNMPLGVAFDIEILSKTLKGCIIDSQSILYKKDGAYILVYEDGRFESQKIEPLLESSDNVLIASCPKFPLAKASKSKLSTLTSYGKVEIVGESK
jgi:RND family efflux transporter MFP subunit